MEFKLPQGMLLGVASAAAQIEGGEVNSSWNDWYRRGRIKDGSDPAASDHWVRWQEDTALMVSMGLQIYRFGVEWARLIPQPGKPDEETIARYRAEITALKERGIRPTITIHHFEIPSG